LLTAALWRGLAHAWETSFANRDQEHGAVFPVLALEHPKNQLMLFGDYDVLQKMRQVDKDCHYPLGYTTLYAKSRNKMLFNPSEMFDRCDELECELIVVPIIFVTTTLIDSASDRGIDVWCYDSNDVRDLRYASGCGVKGVIGDYPKEMMNAFKDLDKGSKPSVH
jgi:hypothetical protein